MEEVDKARESYDRVLRVCDYYQLLLRLEVFYILSRQRSRFLVRPAVAVLMGLSLSGLLHNSRHSPKLHFSPCPVNISVKNLNDDSGIVENVSLPTLLESICPSLKLPYNPPWWLQK